MSYPSHLPYSCCIASSDAGLFRQLTPHDYDVSLRAASANRLDILGVMRASGMNANGVGSSGATALHYAAWHGYQEPGRLLLAHGAGRDADDEYRVVREALDEG